MTRRWCWFTTQVRRGALGSRWWLGCALALGLAVALILALNSARLLPAGLASTVDVVAQIIGRDLQTAAPIGAVQARETPERIVRIDAAELPVEARNTIVLIKKGGPFPYRKDGTVFGNFEKRLPLHERGYYLEYTVPTPGARDRGARRIVAGKAGELYYTDNHYQSFKRVRE